LARKAGPFPDSPFYEVENRRLQRALAIGSPTATGFVRSGQGQVTAGTGAQLVIAAYPDGALIDGLYVENPTSETVTLTTTSGNPNPRIDRLVMRLDMNAKTIAPYQIVGTPAASPSVPSLVRTDTVVDLPLCRYTMPGSASAQNPGGIVDERLVLPSGQWVTVWTSAPAYEFAPSFVDTWTTLPGAGVSTPPVPVGQTLEVDFTAPTCNAGSGFMTMRLTMDGTQRATNVFSAGWAPVSLTWDQPGTGAPVVVLVQGSRSTSDASVLAANGGLMRLRYRIS
jgi:hypothetical protein